MIKVNIFLLFFQMSSYPSCKFQPSTYFLKSSSKSQILYQITFFTIAQMCAFHEETDVCQGDSGGPLTYQSGNIRYQIGVVSYGNRICGRKE